MGYGIFSHRLNKSDRSDGQFDDHYASLIGMTWFPELKLHKP